MSIQLAQGIIEICSDSALSRNFTLRDQMTRAAVSAASNITEGFERDGNREFIHYFSAAKGILGELRAQLLLAFKSGLISVEQYELLKQQCVSSSRLVAGFIRYLKQSKHRGSKYA